METDTEYKAFLETTRDNLRESHAGYFAEDNGKGDEALQKEVDDILRNKEEMLSFRRANGSWNIRRFLFSKWTLREGWDNPNVFVITKLRTSGSEISKLQEVGRGLRLPVDENGKRLSAEEFRLDYIIDWSEKDFASKLVGEINSDGGRVFEGRITDAMIEELKETAYGKDLSTLKLKSKLNDDKIIDDNENIIDAVKLAELLPNTLKEGKVRENKQGKQKVNLRKENWNIIKDLWQEVTKRYMLQFSKLDNGDLQTILQESVKDAFVNSTGQIKTMEMVFDDTQQKYIIQEKVSTISSPITELPYGEFLKRLSKRTSVMPQMWHKAIVVAYYNTPLQKTQINKTFLENIITKFQQQFIEKFAAKYEYSSLDFTANTSLIKNGEFVDAITQGMVGTNAVNDVVTISEKYLYEKAYYDSEIEHEILKTQANDKITVYGKLPRQSIKLPTYTGGTSSPDFVYASNEKLYLFVEVKSDNQRTSDKIAVASQKKFFEALQNENIQYKEITDANNLGIVLTDLCTNTVNSLTT